MTKPKILLLTLEFPQWRDAAKFTYDCNFGLEEGLQEQGVEFTTIPILFHSGNFSGLNWLELVKTRLSGKRYDQVWFDIAHSTYPPEFQEVLVMLAPIRVGFLLESTEFHPLESATGKNERTEKVASSLQIATHLVVVDEGDYTRFNREGNQPAFWWAGGHIPKRLIAEAPKPTTHAPAEFHGTLYGERAKWFTYPALAGLLVQGTSQEGKLPYPAQWDRLSQKLNVGLQEGELINEEMFFSYVGFIRTARRETYPLWLKSLAHGSAVVNLPQFAKAYASRVPQGFAAGRPVITWEIPDRPRTRALYENGKELLLYSQDNPAELAAHIKHVQDDPAFGQMLARNALAKLKRFHTTEKFVEDVLNWLRTGAEPDYGDGAGGRPGATSSWIARATVPPIAQEVPEPRSGNTETTRGGDLEKLKERGLWSEELPLRLHLGCGEQHFDGYVNIDYPSDQHNVMQVKADYQANITQLDFPPESVDEIRLHHVFEHFNRVTALAMLIRWQQWLKVGGVLHIETPDLMGSATTLVSDLPWAVKMGTVRHLAGDQAAAWAYHVDHWFPERYQHTLKKLGFGKVETQSTRWPQPPHLCSVHAFGIKTEVISLEQLLTSADELLWESTVAPVEKPTYEVWTRQLRAVLNNLPCGLGNIHTPDTGAALPTPVAQARQVPVPPLPTRLQALPIAADGGQPLAVIHDFNQRGRDSWVREKASTVPAGSRVLDMGAGTCLYRPLFAHCDYKTHDFKQYEGAEKHGGTAAYGHIDYVSEILAIPAPDHSFDVILCTEVLEHVPEPIKVLKEISRLLRPGGRAFITAPLGSGLHQLPFHFYGGYTPEWYRRFSREAGMEAIEVTPNGGFFKHLAQECARAAGIYGQNPKLHGPGADELYKLLAEGLPRLFFAFDDQVFDERFTVGYFVETVKAPAKIAANALSEIHLGSRSTASKPIGVKLMGGLGNQMFQYATGLALAKKNKTSLFLDLTFLQDKTPRPTFTPRDYALNIFPLHEGCALIENAQAIPSGLTPAIEKNFSFEPKIVELPAGVLLEGYWQSPRYFEDIKSELRGAFALAPKLEKNREELAAQIESKNSVCLHVRRGDMVHNAHTASVHGACTLGYYQEACDVVARRIPDAHFYIFSDDPVWCQTNDLTRGRPNTLVSQVGQSNSSAVDFYLMRACKHFIIANSTFSWWAAYLGGIADKLVIVPEPWFSNPDLDTLDLIPREWVRLCRNPGPVVGEATSVPLVSVIVPCYKQAHFLPAAIESVVAQTFFDWELIIVNDGSPDDTTRVATEIIACHPHRKIRLIVQANGGLARARNAGIKAATGKYILPLDSDDKLAPECLAKTVGYLETHPESKIVTTGRRDFGASSATHTFVKYTLEEVVQSNRISYSTLYRREVWTAVGGYNPNMIWGYEDWDFWIGCAERGWFPDTLPDILFYYRVKSESMLVDAMKHDLELRAQIILNHPGIYAPELLARARSILAVESGKRDTIKPKAGKQDVMTALSNQPEVVKNNRIATGTPAGSKTPLEERESDPGRTKLVAGKFDTDKEQRFLDCYDRYFNHLADQAICLLEIGVFRGGSLLMWQDYFRKGLITGLDRNPVSLKTQAERIRIYQGDQQDADLLKRICDERAPSGFDIIIDDASHIGNLTRETFNHLFDRYLKPGGIYVIEDWGTGYWDTFPDGKKLVKGVPHHAGMVGFIKELVDEAGMDDVSRVVHGGVGPARESKFEEVFFTEGQVFIVKKSASDPSPTGASSGQAPVLLPTVRAARLESSSMKLTAGRFDTDKGQSFLNQYQYHFDHLSAENVRLLEIGVFRGGSLLMWQDYFRNSQIVGLDLNPVTLKEKSERIRIYQGYQQDGVLLDRIRNECAPEGFDIIIDDASHLGNLTRETFNHLFDRHLKPGGIYVIEDWGTGYWDTFSDGRKFTQGIPHDAGMVGFIKELIDEVGMRDATNSSRGGISPARESKFDGVFVTCGQVFVMKKPQLTRKTSTPTPDIATAVSRENSVDFTPVSQAAPSVVVSASNTPPSKRIIALMSSYNEGDVISQVIGDLIENGVAVYLIDNRSTDNTVAEASKWLGKGLLKIEQFPGEAAGYSARCSKEYVWAEILRRKEELSSQLDAAWFLHVDADEFRESPWPGKTLAEAIFQVDELGYSAINFELLNFRPTNDHFVPGQDVRKYLSSYQPGELFDAMQVKAWKNPKTRVEIAANAGHSINFPGRKIFPLNFILRHYPIRGETHGRRKVFSDRLPRFAKEEVAHNWHVQYNEFIDGRAKFLHDPVGLVPYDGDRVRAKLLGTFSQDLLLANALSGASTAVNRLDGKAARSWLERRLSLEEPLANEISPQAEEAVATLLQTLEQKKDLPDLSDDPALRQLLVAVLDMKLAFARLTGDSHFACLATRLKQILETVPSPEKASAGDGAPMVSLCLPTFNGAEYIAETIASALAQTYSSIEIILSDDASTDNTVDIAQGLLKTSRFPVRIFRHARLGLVGNWNYCVEQAKGKYIKFLFQDDLLEPDCVSELVAVAESDAYVGLVFSPRKIERREPEVLNPALEEAYKDGLDVHRGWTRLAPVQPGPSLLSDPKLFQNPINKIGEPTTVLLTKAALESLGGFDANLTQLVDVEMWLRIMTKYKVGFVPRVLSCFRLHGKQATQANLRAGTIAEDWKRFYGKLATHLLYADLPGVHRTYAREMFLKLGGVLSASVVDAPETALANPRRFQDAIQSAEDLVRRGDYKEAIRQTELALKLAPTAEGVSRATEILALLQNTDRERSISTSETPSSPEVFFGAEEMENITQLIAAYVNNPSDPTILHQLFELQRGLTDFLLDADLDQLPVLFKGDFGVVYRALIKSDLASEVPTEDAQAKVGLLDIALAGSEKSDSLFDLRPLLARMLCRPAHRGSEPIALEKIPAWFLDDYLGYALHAPLLFLMEGEADRYHAHMLKWARAIFQRTQTAAHEPLTTTVATYFTGKANYIPLYFSSLNTRELAEKRAAIIEYTLRKNGALIDTKLPKAPKGRKKIKVGFLNAHFGAQTETHVTLPTLQLDRSKFEICLFPVASNPGPVENYCRSFADSFTPLPENIHQQVKKIREAALDVIIVGTNVTAVTNQVALIASHRLAPLQLISYCSPVSSGMRHIDGYLTGTLMDFPGIQEHFTEKLHFCEGPPGCLDYTVEKEGPPARIDRQSLGLADNDIVFINAAACFKILPEMQRTWAKILKGVPHSRLLLLPFNPNWSNAFPAKQFECALQKIFAEYGLGPDRLLLTPSLSSRADVKAIENIADVYLDTYPFSGSISVIDPLEIGLPSVVWEGKTPRSRMASALLRELGISEMIASNEESYIQLSIKLASDPVYRKQISNRIRAAMAGKPTFINPRSYAARLGELIESLVRSKPLPLAKVDASA